MIIRFLCALILHAMREIETIGSSYLRSPGTYRDMTRYPASTECGLLRVVDLPLDRNLLHIIDPLYLAAIR